MTIFMVKTLISIVFLVLALFGACTMFEALGRSEKRFDTDRLKKAHRINGILFFAVFLVLAGLGMAYIARTGAELSPRAIFHVMLAHSVLFLFLLKLAIVKAYRQFYGKVAAIGITVVLLALGTVASSTGYYILSGGLTPKSPRPGTDASGTPETSKQDLSADIVSVQKGKDLYGSKCLSCHDIDSASATGSPGLKGVMKLKALPSSGRPSTADNIALQLKKPYKKMPAFPDLTEEEVANLVAYMKTL